MPCNVLTIDSETKKLVDQTQGIRRGDDGAEGGEGDDTDQDIPPLEQWEDGEGEVRWKRGAARQRVALHGSAMTS